jgi:DNA-binding NarL/FixJ family response regulator
MPFERARTLLCEGEVMRRTRRLVAARAPLREAQLIFQALGARPWADRAATEIAASGGRTHRHTDPALAGLDSLTPQELQIARAVAVGKNNSEAAAALFLSRKTVEAHLTRIYRKLGLGSRTELTRVIVAQGVVD